MNAMTIGEVQRLRDRVKDELEGAATKLLRWGDGWALKVNRRANCEPGVLNTPIYDGQPVIVYSEEDWESKSSSRFGVRR